MKNIAHLVPDIFPQVRAAVLHYPSDQSTFSVSRSALQRTSPASQPMRPFALFHLTPIIRVNFDRSLRAVPESEFGRTGSWRRNKRPPCCSSKHFVYRSAVGFPDSYCLETPDAMHRRYRAVQPRVGPSSPLLHRGWCRPAFFKYGSYPACSSSGRDHSRTPSSNLPVYVSEMV